ncbi:MAG: UvrD-helicase domain-containing protein [Desulfovibrionales bacterium]|nr:UvrD-helicase domain-containing protein [Desulfovibrionales bacterium]
MSREPVDIAARTRALSPAESFHVESPAGAGKTSLLTARFIRLLSVVDHPHEILALTFTNKAANEMRERINALLRQAEKGASPDAPWINSLLPHAQEALKRHKIHINLLKSPDGLRIMTFHSFCLLLIRQSPWEAQVPFDAVVAGDEDQGDLLTEAVRNTQQQIFAMDPDDPLRQALKQRLLHMNTNWPALEAELRQLIARRDLLADLITEVKAVPDKDRLARALAGRLSAFISYRLAELRSSFPATELGANWSFLQAHLHENNPSSPPPASIPGSAWDDLPDWLVIANLCLTKDGKPRKQFRITDGFCKNFGGTHWAECIRNLPERVASQLRSLRELPLPDTPLTDPEALFDLILMVGKTMRAYDAICRRRGVMDYVELELAALRALGGEDTPADLQLLLDRKIQHILVDEFQDTSRNQWHLLQHLCAGWQPGDGRTVFIVGDPKQSIYGFRKAEVSIFMEAREGIPIPGQGYLKLTPVNLTTNFRSCAKLIDFTNEVFGQTVMARPDEEVDEVPYQAFLPAPGKEGRGRIVLATFTKNDGSPNEARFREAGWLAGEVKRFSANCDGKTIGILLPARTYLAAYLKALTGEGLQVQVQEGILLKERPEVVDMHSLALAMVRPHDDLVWASLLRSAWCWVGLDILYEVSRQNGISWSQKIERFKHSAVAPEALKNLWESIALYSPQIGRRPLTEVVGTIWESVNGPAAVCARFGPAGVENCRQFLKILADAESGIPEETLSRLNLLLETAYAPPDPLSVRSPVQIMTVHRAKGLEFDAVFLPYLDWNPLGGSGKDSPPYLLERLPGSAGEHLIALSPDRRFKKEDKTYNLLKDIWKRRQLAESKRLFYVAATRAKKELYLSGLVTERDGESSATKNSFLSYLLAHTGLKTKVESISDPVLSATEVAAPAIAIKSEVPAPIPFTPERLPYQVISPSSLKGEMPLRESGFNTHPLQISDYHLARGTVIHRLFEHLATKGTGLPSERAVAAAMLSEGVDKHTSQGSAKGILAEFEACLKEEFCAYILRTDHPFAASEWMIEDQPAVDALGRKTGTVRSGIIDRVVFDGDYWWLVDYKTTPLPSSFGLEEFLKEQEMLYHGQLLSYREMLARQRQIDPVKIRLILYFTAIQKSHEIK